MSTRKPPFSRSSSKKPEPPKTPWPPDKRRSPPPRRPDDRPADTRRRPDDRPADTRRRPDDRPADTRRRPDDRAADTRRDDAPASEKKAHTGPHPRTGNAPEHKISGRNACRALFATRRDAIRRVYVTEENLKDFGDVLRWCAQQRVAYHVKTREDLDQVAETVHHDGVLFLAHEKPPLSLDALLGFLPDDGPMVLVLLEDVKNPHNLGAILRVCAHFGVQALLAAGSTPPLSPAAMRTAEGGAEHTHVVEVQDGVKALAQLKARGFRIIATTSHTGLSLGREALPPRCVILFGSEGAGLSRRLMAAADVTVAIPGSGALESLNVACAASVLLWEHWRAAAPGPPVGKPPVSRGARR